MDGDCSHEIKQPLLFGRKAVTNLDSHIKKQRHHFADKGPSSQSYGFSDSHVWMWELDYKESWVLKNWCFWIVPEKTFGLQRDPICPILKVIIPENSLEGLLLKLKPQYFGHLMQRTDSLEKALILGKTEGSRRREWQRMRWLDDINILSRLFVSDSLKPHGR